VVTRCLSFHAAYRCRHRGACCEADWQIEVDPALAEAVTVGRLRAFHGTPEPFVRQFDAAGHPVLMLARAPSGACGFRHRERCSLQAAGGEAALPQACRHFPRVLLHDARGTLLTLSHFCPTAAAMLVDDDGRAEVVEARPPLALEGALEGLDARDALPPSLRPGMLMDHASYDAWEQRVVRLFANSSPVADAFRAIVAATERLRGWSPGDGPLEHAVAHAFQGPPAPPDPPGFSRGFETVLDVTGPHPLLDVPMDVEHAWTGILSRADADVHRAIGRYMAAATFANWMAYRGQGLRSIVEWLRACYDVLRLQVVEHSTDGAIGRDGLIEAFRMADYLLVHIVDSETFGRAIAPVECEHR